jgi:DNA-directed RNA polymerase subunit RPC12/RpoP
MATTIAISCPKCEKQINAPAELAGKKIRCKECLYVFVVKAPPAPKGGGKPAKGAKEAAAGKPGKAAKPAAKGPAPDDDEEGSTPYQVTQTSLLPHCAYCAKEMEYDGQVVCIHCGYNHRTRERVPMKKTYETTGGQQFMWLLPGILCALGVLAMIGIIVVFFAVFPRIEADNDQEWWSIFFGLWARLWGAVICLFAGFFLARFAVKRLILNATAPEREKLK